MLPRYWSAWLVVVTSYAILSAQDASVQCELTPLVKLTAPDGKQGDGFGWALGLDGDLLVVGAPFANRLIWDWWAIGDEGAAYIYRRTNGQWAEEKKLLSYSGTNGARFGSSVSISGGIVFVGAPYEGSGRVYVFQFDGLNWVQQQILSSADPTISLSGSTVKVQNDRAVVGGRRVVEGTTRVLVSFFTRTGAGWVESQVIEPPAPGVEDFAKSVALDQDTLIIAARSSVYVFAFDGTHWNPQATLTAPEAAYAESWGAAVSVRSDTMMVEAPPDDGSALTKLFVFQRAAGVWNYEQAISVPQHPVFRSFGPPISLASGLAASAAFGDRGYVGVFTYRNCGGIWTPEQIFVRPPDPFGKGYARAIAAESDTLVVGAWNAAALHGGIPEIHAGVVYVYEPGSDCNANGMLDSCELGVAPDADCDHNLVFDACEAWGDCNANGRLDLCDLADGSSVDCNANAVPDECDIASGFSEDVDHDGIPDECATLFCADPSFGPVFSLRAVGINGQPFLGKNEIRARSGDVIETEVSIRCWSCALDELRVYEASILIADGALSGTSGSVLPVGWDRPFERDACPCDDPRFPICPGDTGCVGPDHDPDSGAFIDVTRSDYILSGLEVLAAVDNSGLFRFRFGGTTFGGGRVDDGRAHYAGTLLLRVGADACGTFTFEFDDQPPIHSYLEAYNYACDAKAVRGCARPAKEQLSIHICEDDGLFCNGLETCDPTLGCQITPPNCGDGVACTVDSCDETILGCRHVLNDALCDDVNPLTLDECTPSGCTHTAVSIPTVSQWGLVVLTLLLLSGAKIRFGRAPRYDRLG